MCCDTVYILIKRFLSHNRGILTFSCQEKLGSLVRKRLVSMSEKDAELLITGALRLIREKRNYCCAGTYVLASCIEARCPLADVRGQNRWGSTGVLAPLHTL